MKALRLSAAAVVVASVLAVVWSIGAGCGPAAPLYTWNCGGPDGGSIGTDVSGDLVCPCGGHPGCCIDGPVQAGPYPVGNCPFLDAGLMCGPGTIRVGNECVPDNGDGGDAGDSAEGGPLEPVTACTGACWPVAGPEWAPVLLWTGVETSAPLCAEAGLVVIFDGTTNDATSTFGLACTSNASGSCPGTFDVCGPAPAGGFQSCIMHDDVASCASLSPYPDQWVFYEGTAPELSQPSTFCCPAPPIMPP
jgi:hypothetical protein